MTKTIRVIASAEEAEQTVSVTAAPGSAGQLVAGLGTTSRVELANLSGGCPVQFKIGDAAWAELPFQAGRGFAINAADVPVRLRRAMWDGGPASVRVATEGALLIPAALVVGTPAVQVPPAITAAPALSGGGTVGQPITLTLGTVTGTPTPASTAAWRDASGTLLSTSLTNFTPTAAGTVTVEQMADNGVGQPATRMSNTVTVAAAGGSDGYDIILIAGSSNGSGKGVVEPAIDVSDPKVFQFGGASSNPATYQKITLAAEPLRHPDLTTGVGPGMAFARRYAAATGRKVLLVPMAFGGSSVVEGDDVRWSPYGNTTTSSLFRTAIAQANLAIAAAQAAFADSRFVGVLASFGGNDAEPGTITRAAWIQPYRDVIAGFRSQITGAADSWLVNLQMLPETITRLPIRKILDDAQREVSASTSRASFVAIGLGFPLASEAPNYLHYNAQGQRGTDGIGGIGGLAYTAGLPAAVLRLSTAAPGVPGVPALDGGAGTTAANFVWAQPGGGLVSDFNFRYRVVGAGAWTNLSRAVSTQAVAAVTGLTAGTTYEAQAQAVGPAGTSAWSASFTFATAGGASTPGFARLIIAQGSNMIEAGDATIGWSYGADVVTASSTTHAGFSDKKLGLGTPGYVEMTVGSPQSGALNHYFGLVTSFSDPGRLDGTAGYKYAMIGSTATPQRWGVLQEGVATSLPANGTSSLNVAVGDKYRLAVAADGTVTALVARAATPTDFTLVHTFANKATTDLWPAFSFGMTGSNVAGRRDGPLYVGAL